MTLSLKSMRYFNTAVAQGSIAQAAAQLNIAASAVSVAIDQVEQEFGLTLVTRQRARGITATASGRQIVQKFARLLEDYDAVLVEGAALQQSLSGALRIGYYAPVAPSFLPHILTKALPDPDDVTLHFQEYDNLAVQDALLNGDVDLILFVADGAKAAIAYDVLVDAPPYCLMSATHPLASRDTVSMAEIAKEPLVALDRPGVASYYRQFFNDLRDEVHVIAYANSTEMVRSLVGQGFGCAVLNMRPRIDRSYGNDGLACLPIRDAPRALTLAIGYDQSRPRRIVSHVVEACRQYFATDGQHHCVMGP